MQTYANWYRDQQGNAVQGGQVAVYNANTSTLSTIYEPSADGNPTSTKANPFTTDANGFFQFAAPNGDYAIQLSGNSVSTATIQNINLWDGGTSTGGPMTNPMSALGDMIYGGVAGTPTALSGNTGASVRVLSQTGDGVNSAPPVWNSTTGTGNVAFSASPTFTGTAVFDGISASGQHIANASVTDSISNPYRQFVLSHKTTINAINYAASLRGEVYPVVNSGVTNSGFSIAGFFINQRNSNSSTFTGDNGTIQGMYCAECSYGHLNDRPGDTPITNTMHGLRMRRWLNSGSGTTWYDLKIENSGVPGGTFSGNLYSIYIDDCAPMPFSGTKYALFTQGAGLVRINDTTASSSYTTGAITTAGGLGVAGNIYTNANLDVTGTTFLRGSFVAVSNRLNLAAIAAPGNNGDIWQDSTQKTFGHFVAGIKQHSLGVIYTSTATATVANTTTETSIIGSGVGSKTLPANFFVAGKTVRVTLRGVVSTTGTPNLQIKAKYGTTVILDSTALAVAAAIPANANWEATVDITCRTTGATGTVQCAGNFNYQTASTSAGAGHHWLPSNLATIDTTASSALDVTATWGTASASNTISGVICTVEVLN